MLRHVLILEDGGFLTATNRSGYKGDVVRPILGLIVKLFYSVLHGMNCLLHRETRQPDKLSVPDLVLQQGSVVI